MREEQQFNELKNQIQTMDLDKDQVKSLKNEYQDLRNNGVSQSKALATAIRLAGLSQEVQEAESRGAKMARMGLNPHGQQKSMKHPKEPDLVEMSDDDFLKESDKLAGTRRPIYKK